MTPRRVRVDWRYLGGRKPDGVEMVTRGTRWGNPFKADEHGLARCLELFRAYALERLAREPEWLDPLRGHDLACWCRPDEPCHADILIDLN